MPTSKQQYSFADGMHKIAHELATMELDPAADHEFIGQMRSVLVGYQQAKAQGEQPGQAGGAPGMGGPVPAPNPSGLPVPVPTTEGDMSRGPRPNPDTSGAVSELQRVMAGS